MIKFFKKIRQQLLTENKLSKYLIYAIGEIILVVIGILIALQINNWNKGNYKLLIEAKLEDLAGNNLNRLFDTDITQATNITKVTFRYHMNFIIN